MSVFSKLAGGAFSHVLCASVIQISNTSHFVEFEASFWVIFLVFLCISMEKGRKETHLKKATKKDQRVTMTNLGSCSSGGGVS